MAHKIQLLAIFAALLAISAGVSAASLSLRDTDSTSASASASASDSDSDSDSESAVSELGSAASAGAGGNSSSALKEDVASFYFKVQDVAASIAASGVNTTTVGAVQYAVFKAALDKLENLWRDGSTASLLQIPLQLQVVQAASLLYASQVQSDVASLSGDQEEAAEELVTKLQTLASSADEVSKEAAAEIFTEIASDVSDAVQAGEEQLSSAAEAMKQVALSKVATAKQTVDTAVSNGKKILSSLFG